MVYNPSQIYTVLKFGALSKENFSKAAKQLLSEGFGEKKPTNKSKKEVQLTMGNFELVMEGEKPGVYFLDNHGEAKFVCSPLEILAETQTKDGECYGRLLRWTDSKTV